MKPPSKTRTQSRAKAPVSPDASKSPVFSGIAPSEPLTPPPADAPRSPKANRTSFKPGQSGNPAGRPQGSFNKATLAARAILAENATLLFSRAVEMAVSGKTGAPLAMKLCLERLVPIPHDRPIQLPVLNHSHAPKDLVASHTSVVRALEAGRITPHEAHVISLTLEGRRRSWEASELAERINKLEEAVQDANDNKPHHGQRPKR